VNQTESFEAFRERCTSAAPEVFLVLGSGMGPIIRRVRELASLPFGDIPGLPSSSVLGHKGCITLAEWLGRAVLISEGRLHFYEGHSWETVVHPIQFAAHLGVKRALLTNAAGGIRADLGPGALMPIRDHLEWNLPYPWRAVKKASPYSPRMVERLVQAGKDVGLDLVPGIYAAVTGPNYETPAEIRALRTAGADSVGMSTSREVAAGVEAGLECGAISLITNCAAGLSSAPLSHEEVLATAQVMAERLADLLQRVIVTL
jgi:purine-nucleoside phosphorylase